MPAPDLSVIIVNYNTFDLTCACIRSVIKHTVGIAYEIILVDNHSEVFLADQFKEEFPQVILIENEENLGFSKANNIGIENSRGAYVLLLNSDAYLVENSCKSMLDWVRSDAKIGALSPQVVYPNGAIQHVAQRFPKLSLLLFELFRLQKVVPAKWAGKVLLGSFFNHQETLEVDWIWGTCFLLRREVVDLMPLGKLDESYFMYSEDMQWCKDIKRKGFKVVYFSDTRVVHLKGASASGPSHWQEKSLQLFMDKNYHQVHSLAIRLLQRLLKASLRKVKGTQSLS